MLTLPAHGIIAGMPTLRPGTDADRRFMAEILRLAALGSYPELAALGRVTLRERLETLYASYDGPARRWWVLEDAEAPVAGLWALVQPHPIQETPEGVVVAIATLPAHRGRGHARTLLTGAEAELRQEGARQLRLFVHPDNTAARRLYAALGFAPTLLELTKP